MAEATNAGAADKVVIWPRRWVVVVMATISLAFIVGGAILVFAGDDLDVPPELALPVGIVAMLLGLPTCALQVHRLLSPQPALILDREGLTDHSSAAGAGFLPWGEISAVRVYNIGRNTMVGIDLRDRKELMSRQSGIVRLLVRANVAIGCSPVNIAENGLPMTAQQLADEIERFRKAAAPAAPAAPTATPAAPAISAG